MSYSYILVKEKLRHADLWRQLGIMLLLVFAVFGPVAGNNLQLSNISASTTGVTFTINWDNSWNLSTGPANWDAAWVFVKFQDCSTDAKTWNHQALSANSEDHSVSGGVLEVDAVADGMGVFIRRSSTGSGSISASTVNLLFGTAFSSIANVNFEVLSIEMVYVPQGAFYVGDGSTASAPTSQYSMGNNGTSNPTQITSEAAITANALYNSAFGAPTANPLIPDSFPKGYNGFYCMKYEIDQNQYIQFLNLLSATQQSNRTAVPVTSVAGTLALAPSGSPNRNAIKIKTSASGAPLSPAVYGTDLNGNGVYDEAGDGGDIACNYLTWDDLLAYLDWAALRPMTELEFEKAARGPSSAGTPVLTAFAWNTTTILAANSGAVSNGGFNTEISTSSGNGLCAYNSSNSALGPLRVGFAATAATNQAGAGASYYGILDLCGNVWEQAYHIGYNNGTGTPVAATFTGVLGDGLLDILGFANASTWGGQNGVIASVVRGGNWYNLNNAGSQYCQISNRNFISSGGSENGTRVARTGGRGVRQY